MSEFEYAEEVNQFINNETISEIIIVNDIQCTFICNTINKDKNHDTIAERELEKLMTNNNSKFDSIGKVEQNKLLAKLNIYRQYYELLDVAFIGNKINDEIIKVSGLIYNRIDSSFEKLEL
tara:strand:+ start:167 stop:529 length:363 start_codon:yes stop_codon:yes gene_type:complete